MAVFTPVTQSDLTAWLAGYSAGQWVEFQPVASGIENTNYFVTTTQGRYVLTLFEKLGADELPYYLSLMDHLAQRGIPCPRPMRDGQQRLFSTLCNKPATLVSRLPGQSHLEPTVQDCQTVGALVAELHLAAVDFPLDQANPRGLDWWRRAAPEVTPFLDQAQRRLLEEELDHQARHQHHDLPRGAIHADLFRDNVLMEGERIGGVIDFYFAGSDAWLYDLAIVVNDWCVTADAALDLQRTAALLSAYQGIRPVSAEEQSAWPVSLRGAALRFWLSRLYDKHRPRPGEIIQPHDPLRFERILRSHIEHPPGWAT